MKEKEAAPKSDPSPSRLRPILTLRVNREIVGAVLTCPVVPVVVPIPVVAVVIVARRHVGIPGFIGVRVIPVARGEGISKLAWVVEPVTAVVGRAGDRRAGYRTTAEAVAG